MQPIPEYLALYSADQPQRVYLEKADTFIQIGFAEQNQNRIPEAVSSFSSGLQLFFLIFDRAYCFSNTNLPKQGETNPEKKATLGAFIDQLLTKVELLKSSAIPVTQSTPQHEILIKIQEINFFKIDLEASQRTHLHKEGHILQIVKLENSKVALVHSSGHQFELSQNPCVAVGGGQYLLETPQYCFGIEINPAFPHLIIEFETILEMHSCLRRIAPPPIQTVQPSKVEVAEELEIDQQIPKDTPTASDTQTPEEDEWCIIETDPNAPEEFEYGSIFQTGVQDYHINYVATGLETAATFLAGGIGYGAQALQKGIIGGGALLKNKIDANEKDAEISPTLQKALQFLKEFTPKFATATGAIVETISDISVDIGTSIGNQVVKAISKEDLDKERDPRLNALVNLAQSSLTAFSTVSESIDNAGGAVFGATADATISILGHKYGENVGIVTQDAFDIGKDVLSAAGSVKSLTSPKAMAKSLSKKAATGAVKTVLLHSATSGQSDQQVISEENDSSAFDVEEEILSFSELSPSDSTQVQTLPTVPSSLPQSQ